MPKISVIIPVYNTARYLYRCLDSILGQTMEDLEIICVDDGSTDGSSKILDSYAAKEPRMKVIHKQNGGLVSARKAGVQVASGTYAGYVDSDDWIEKDMFENLYELAQTYHVDLVTSGYFYEGNYVTEHFDTVAEGLYTDENMKSLRENTIYFLPKKETGLRATLCTKLFSRELLQKIQCQISDKVSISEDKLCLLTYILECKSVFVSKKAYYHYMINSQSMVHTVNCNYLLCVNELYRCFSKLYEHPRFTDQMRTQVELYITDLLIKGINTFLGFRTRNLLWFDPYWMENIPSGSRIMLYGIGEAGKKCQQQLMSRKDLVFAGYVDFEYKKPKMQSQQVQMPKDLKTDDYDFIVITIKNPTKASQIRKQLEDSGIPSEKILWFEQRELFWKYAQAEGLLTEEN